MKDASLHVHQMPKLVPLPLPTKGQPFYKRIWIWLTKVREWQLLENWEYDLPDGRRVLIPKGFRFDGASIPRPLWFFLSPTGLLLIPGLIHDFGYRYDYIWVVGEDGWICKNDQAMGQDYWDEIFYSVGEHVNGMKVINWMAWLALSTFGSMAWDENRKRAAQDIIPTRIKQGCHCSEDSGSGPLS